MLIPEGPPKFCPDCGFKRPRKDFYGHRAPNGRVYAQPVCKTHDVARVRKWQKDNPKRSLELQREKERRIREDPERLAIYRDQHREYSRRVNGITPDRYRVIPTTDRLGRDLDPEPFATWLRTLGPSAEQIAYRCEMEPAQVRRYLAHKQRPSEEIVERALVRSDSELMPEDLYPELTPHDAALAD